MPCQTHPSWEGNRRSGVTPAVRHGLCGVSVYGLNGLREGAEHPTYTPVMPNSHRPHLLLARCINLQEVLAKKHPTQRPLLRSQTTAPAPLINKPKLSHFDDVYLKIKPTRSDESVKIKDIVLIGGLIISIS